MVRLGEAYCKKYISSGEEQKLCFLQTTSTMYMSIVSRFKKKNTMYLSTARRKRRIDYRLIDESK